MEITAKLKTRAVFLSGEKVECVVTFTNVGTRIVDGIPDLDAAFSLRGSESLAWSSVQIQCLCHKFCHPGTLATGSKQPTGPTSLTSLTANNEGGDNSSSEIGSTSPKILFCDLVLGPGESRSYVFEDFVPHGCPSTYHGKHVRYSHRLVIASQRINRPIATLRVPIRVLSISRENDGRRSLPEQKDKPVITNPFVSRSIAETDDDDDDEGSKMLLINELSGRKKATYYDVKAPGGKKVGKLCLFKNAFKLGEDILGLFDFSDVDVMCLQYSVSLISVESLEDRQSQNSQTKQTCQEFCYGYAETSFSLAVPLHVTPSFRLEKCHLDWQLRFEFVISKFEIGRQPFIDESGDVTSMGHEWNGPPKLEVETMTWNLPVTLLPTHPQNLVSAVQLPLVASKVM